MLAVHQAVVIGEPSTRAREFARAFVGPYLSAPNYLNNLQRFSFSERDLADGGSDRLLDALVATGDADEVAVRVRAHLDAGADHVCVTPLRPALEVNV